jgi:hypothetical protein
MLMRDVMEQAMVGIITTRSTMTTLETIVPKTRRAEVAVEEVAPPCLKLEPSKMHSGSRRRKRTSVLGF